jgi:RHS repeat-associated protein
LLGTVKEGSITKAQYRWLSDGTKAGVRNTATGTLGYEYLGSLIYKRTGSSTVALEGTAFGGGRINKTSSSYEVNYQIADHLGSPRVVFKDTNTILARNDYYAFGKRHANPLLPAGDDTRNRWLYNGKERQTTGNVGFFDYGARMYDPEIARWTTVDPLAEKYYSWSPYNYVMNSPVRYIDPDGRAPGDVFETVQLAAKDWGDYYNGASILRGVEFGSTIYKTIVDGETGYAYSVANEGRADRVTLSQPDNGETVVADIHSHGEYLSSSDNDFSSGDKWGNYKAKRDGYLTTPDGSLKKYDPYTTETSIISTELPSDPKDISRKNEKVPVDILREEAYQMRNSLEQKKETYKNSFQNYMRRY